MNLLEHKLQNKRWRMNHTQFVFLSFIIIIVIGSLLLSLPFARKPGVESAGYLNSLFTATSAVCVTGLVTLTTATHWSLFGQIVIMVLIQLGGLSFIAFYSYFLIHMGKKVTMDDRLLIQTTFNQTSMQGMAKMVLMIIRGTLLVEGIGAVVLFLYFLLKAKLPFGTALFWGIFHSVSGFCNAGFDVIGEENLAPYVGSFVINVTIMSLIIIGGIGFVVWKEVLQSIKQRRDKTIPNRKKQLSIHTKLALFTTIVLIVSGAIYFFIVEGNNPETMQGLSLPKRILASFFQSVTLRTAGFSTIPQGGLKDASKFVSSVFMLVGGSPGGTAGGIKTVTIAIIFACVWSTLRGRSGIAIMNRNIPLRILQKALTITTIMVSLLFIGTAILSITETNSPFEHNFLDLLYEVSSALGTVGLTTGITPYLSNIGKVVIIIFMITGRLGPLTVFYALTKNMISNKDLITLPDEDVLIG